MMLQIVLEMTCRYVAIPSVRVRFTKADAGLDLLRKFAHQRLRGLVIVKIVK